MGSSGRILAITLLLDQISLIAISIRVNQIAIEINYRISALKWDLLRSGSEDSSACTDCPAGKYCKLAGSGTWTDDCCVGYYCPAGSSVCEQNICPVGSQVGTGVTSRDMVWRHVTWCDATWEDHDIVWRHVGRSYHCVTSRGKIMTLCDVT